ncbi:hypothetical protein LDK10_05720 [Fusobacterium animalis]
MMKQDYFKSKASMYLFALLEITGKVQLDLLGITYNHYKDKESAKNWYEDIMKTIKNSNHTNLENAIRNLKMLYAGMLG